MDATKLGELAGLAADLWEEREESFRARRDYAEVMGLPRPVWYTPGETQLINREVDALSEAEDLLWAHERRVLAERRSSR